MKNMNLSKEEVIERLNNIFERMEELATQFNGNQRKEGTKIRLNGEYITLKNTIEYPLKKREIILFNYSEPKK